MNNTENNDVRGHFPYHGYEHPITHTHDEEGVRLTRGYRPTTPLIDIVRPPGFVERHAQLIVIIAAIIAGLILGWVTAPFGIVPT